MKTPRNSANTTLILTGLLGLAAMGVSACSSPDSSVASPSGEAELRQSNGQTAPTDQSQDAAFDLADLPQQPVDALKTLEILALDGMEGRQTGTRGGERARIWLAQQLKARGLLFPSEGDVEGTVEGYEHRFSFSQRTGKKMNGVNLIARIPSRFETPNGPVMIVSAHFDHEGIRVNKGVEEIYNGADDNASGVAGVLAIADHFLANPPDHEVIIALFDAEEMRLQGAKAFLRDEVVDPERIVLNLNFDMISRNDDNEIYIAGSYHTPGLKTILAPVIDQAPVTIKYGHDDPKLGSNDWTNQSDHGPFHKKGIPFVYFGVEDHADYHQPTDVFATIPKDFFLRSIETVIMAAEQLDRELDEVASLN